MKSTTFFFCLLLLAMPATYAQDIYIAVYNGKVTFEDGRQLELKFKYSVPRQGKLFFDDGSSSIVFTKDKYFTVVPGRDPKNLTFNDIRDSLGFNDFAKKFQSLNAQGKGSFTDYLLKLHQFSSLNETSRGGVVGGVSGINGRVVSKRNKEGFKATEDYVRMLSGNAKLQWPAASRVFGCRLIIIDLQTKDTVYNELAPQENNAMIPMEKEGTYKWLLYTKLEGAKHSGIFVIPNEEEKKRLQNQVVVFKQQLESFNDEVSDYLLEDFLAENKLIEN